MDLAIININQIKGELSMVIYRLEALFFLIVTVKIQQVFCESLIIILLC